MANPIDADAITMGDYAMLSQNPIEKGIVMAIYDTVNVIKDVPLTVDNRFKVTQPRLEADGLPEIAWGRINREPTTTKGSFKQQEAAASIVRSRIRLDKRLKDQPNQAVEQVRAQVMAWAEAWALEATDVFFNNDPFDVVGGGKEDAWAGLRTMLDNPVTYGMASEMKIDAGGISLLRNMSASDADIFIQLIDEILSKMGAPDGQGVVFYINEVVERRWASAIRKLGIGGGFSSTKDAFDRQVQTYRGAKIRNVGRKRDQTSYVIPVTEDTTGLDSGTGDRTSIYAVRYGDGRFKGWHDGAPTPEYTGILDDGVTHQWLIDYLCGLNPSHNRCVARGFNIEIS